MREISCETVLESKLGCETLLRQAFDLVARLVQAAVIVTDSRGITQWVNPGLERLTGYTSAELIGRTPGAILQGAGTDARTVDMLRDHLGRAEPVYVEILNYHKDGHEFWQSLDIVPVSDREGQVAGFVGLQNDVSYRRRIENHLLETVAEEQRRIAGALHDELGQQLTGVLLFASALNTAVTRRCPELVSSVQQMTDAIKCSIQQCRQLAINTSGFAAIGPNSGTAIEAIVQQAGKIGNIAPRVRWSSEISTVLSDVEFHDVYRIVQESVTNAARHAKAARIEVTGELTSSEIKISISDDGIGMGVGISDGIRRHLMSYRARRIGATLRIDTRPAFPGTRVTLCCLRRK